ncbi:MAG TPA: glutathionylspermidine synthase family protein [Pyrinomonadaceae bacterium]|nr:glutathionylspermidine synthase family protein [Pyrinomonadaceae bacterium]
MHQSTATESDYASFARAVYETGVISDPWFDGRERFGLRGVVLGRERARQLLEAAERVTYLHQELVEILLENPSLVAEFYQLTPWQQLMWETAGGLWHGMARADLFVCEDRKIRCCELNSDTPSGQPEAVILNEMLREAHGPAVDPNAGLRGAFVRMLRESHAKRTDRPLSVVGIIYPTELSEDLAMITLFSRWLERAGVRVVCGSPFNVRRSGRGGVEVLGVAVDLIYRHYKTDWWGERAPVWADAPEYPDPLPLDGPLSALVGAEMDGHVTVVNPFGAIVTQNKLSLAFFWEEQDRFSREARGWIRRYIPETRRLSTLSLDELRAEREEWVLKSDYGCEGLETVCGPFVSQEVWEKAIGQALPERFVAQKFFRAEADEEGRLANYGVYVLGGTASGFFTRLSHKSTEYTALTVPTFIKK